MDLEALKSTCATLKAEIGKVVVGQDQAIDLMLIGLLVDGHVLLESVPGTAKTLLARTFAASLSLDFGRIQFTPDLMPGDVIGTNLFNFQTNDFALTKGPIFTDLLLADEINRTPPKTQAALLEAMQERSVTIDGDTYSLGGSFMVIATQNPIEQQGTYPLPEAQLDRFLFKHILDYPTREQEAQVVARHGASTTMQRPSDLGVRPVTNAQTLADMRALVAGLRIAEEIVLYIVDFVRATREHAAFQFGASPRAATMLAAATRAYAALNGRDFVLPDDVKALSIPALRHRVVLAPGAEIEGLKPETALHDLLDQIPAPR